MDLPLNGGKKERWRSEMFFRSKHCLLKLNSLNSIDTSKQTIRSVQTKANEDNQPDWLAVDQLSGLSKNAYNLLVNRRNRLYQSNWLIQIGLANLAIIIII